MLSRETARAVARPVAEVLVCLLAMQGIFYYLWVPLEWPSLVMVGLILAVGQVVRVVRGPRGAAHANVI